LKPVPDPKNWDLLKMDERTKTLIRDGIPSAINPLDKHALEAGLQVKDTFGAEVVILSMAPPFVAPVLREALAMGADRAVLLSDRVFAGSDTLATARVLAEGVRRIGAFDLICCGNYTVDGSTAQVPSQVAELLGVPNVMHVSQMEFSPEQDVLITQEIERGYARLEGKPPLLLSFIKEANRPRYVSFLEMLEAEKREIATWSNQDLGLDESLIGLGGSPTKMADLLLRKKGGRSERPGGVGRCGATGWCASRCGARASRQGETACGSDRWQRQRTAARSRGRRADRSSPVSWRRPGFCSR
jgi:electron transfer flavoprotein beta subunit